MAFIKTNEEIEILREGGRRLSAVLLHLEKAVAPGVSTVFLNDMADRMIRELGDEPSFLNYTPYGADRPYPAALCVSVNHEVVHGIPNEKERFLKEGDIVGLDIGLKHRGLFVDTAVTVPVGVISETDQKLIDATKKSLDIAIAVCRAGNRVNDIGCAIEKYVKPLQYGLVEDLGGHGVGHAVHEEPYIHNYCIRGKSPVLKENMVIAIEPMLNLGTKHVVLDEDGYTYKTADGKKSAHFEHTILITAGAPEIITARFG